MALGLALGGCGGGSSTPGGGGGQSGQVGGGAGTTGASGVSGSSGSSGAAGDTSGMGGGGAAGTTTTGAGGAGGALSGAGGSPDAGGGAGAAAGAGGGAAGATDAGTPTDAGPRSTKVLIYGVTTGFRHGSIPAAAMAITTAAATKGLTTELVGCGGTSPNTPDPTKLTADALAGYGAVILLANSGEPFGYPATQEIQNLVAYVQNGGALVGIEDADHCYDGQFGHPATVPYVNLIGNDFVGHPGGVAPATCTTMGTSPAVMQLPATFGTTDEIYATTMFRMDNQTVLTCVSSGDGTKTMRPVSYVREEGMGRVFYTALGHDDARWTAPMDAAHANSRLVEDHVLPALLWAMRR